jgi:hypothetical protein
VTRTKDEIRADIEPLLVEYLQAGTDVTTLMLDSYVIKARAVDIARPTDQQAALGTMVWFTAENQDVFKSMGLAGALAQDVDRYYEDLYDGAEPLDQGDND